VDDDGDLVGPGDFEAQARRTFDNLGRVLAEAGGTFADIVKLTVYLTDMSRLPEYARIKADYVHGQQPASTAVGVAGLAVAGLMIEVEATAVL
jgi:2-iminobutanoate/2-iminopropanoate deaminase